MLFQPTYFAPVMQYVALAQAAEIVFEVHDNFQKQTYRNRCYIYGANGKQQLTVPLEHSKSAEKIKTRDIKIDNNFDWQKLHFKALQSAYSSSPFFEFYEDDLVPLFETKHEFLLDLNFKTFEVLCASMQVAFDFKKTTAYQTEIITKNDFRYLANAKKEEDYPLENYVQVFDDKHGFISNLSILDLLFNEGPIAMNYLERQQKLFGL